MVFLNFSQFFIEINSEKNHKSCLKFKNIGICFVLKLTCVTFLTFQVNISYTPDIIFWIDPPLDVKMEAKAGVIVRELLEKKGIFLPLESVDDMKHFGRKLRQNRLWRNRLVCFGNTGFENGSLIVYRIVHLLIVSLVHYLYIFSSWPSFSSNLGEL